VIGWIVQDVADRQTDRPTDRRFGCGECCSLEILSVLSSVTDWVKDRLFSGEPSTCKPHFPWHTPLLLIPFFLKLKYRLRRGDRAVNECPQLWRKK